jgi:hypothetical protein
MVPQDASARSQANDFLDFDYQESKDICETFLTVIAGVLAFTVTFADKTGFTSSAPWLPKSLMLGAWLVFAWSLVACVMGLWLMFGAGHAAKYQPDSGRHRTKAQQATWCWKATALLFQIGFVLLIAAGAALMTVRTQ